MSRLIADAMLPEKLKTLSQPVELVDASGHILGTFLPHFDASKWEGLEPQISAEEMERRRKEPGGRPLKNIVDDWRKGEI